MAANDFNVLYRARVSGIPLDNYFFFKFMFYIVQYFNLRIFEQVELLLLHLANAECQAADLFFRGKYTNPTLSCWKICGK